jgi:DNA-binding NtrC family response regulator
MTAILVVEDEPDVAEALRSLLTTVPGWVVEVAGSVAAAREALRLRSWQILLSDERLPDGSGTDLLAEASVDYPATRRVLFTGYSNLEVAIGAVNRGHADYYVEKPWDPEALMALLGRLALGPPLARSQPSALGRIPPTPPSASWMRMAAVLGRLP